MDVAFCSACVQRCLPCSWNLLSAIQGQGGDDSNGILKLLKARLETARGILSLLFQLVRIKQHHWVSLKLARERMWRADLPPCEDGTTFLLYTLELKFKWKYVQTKEPTYILSIFSQFELTYFSGSYLVVTHSYFCGLGFHPGPLNHLPVTCRQQFFCFLKYPGQLACSFAKLSPSVEISA